MLKREVYLATDGDTEEGDTADSQGHADARTPDVDEDEAETHHAETEDHEEASNFR